MNHKLKLLGALACTAWALPATPAEVAVPEALKACATIKRDSERLACYDHAISDLNAGKAATPQASAENMFGASPAIAPPPPSAAPEAKRDELKQITAQVVSLKRQEDGGLVLTLDNDQVWRQQDSDSHLFVETGDSITISRASLGTFRITDTRGRSARFKRVR